jgi:hypothetical protein
MKSKSKYTTMLTRLAIILHRYKCNSFEELVMKQEGKKLSEIVIDPYDQMQHDLQNNIWHGNANHIFVPNLKFVLWLLNQSKKSTSNDPVFARSCLIDLARKVGNNNLCVHFPANDHFVSMGVHIPPTMRVEFMPWEALSQPYIPICYSLASGPKEDNISGLCVSSCIELLKEWGHIDHGKLIYLFGAYGKPPLTLGPEPEDCTMWDFFVYLDILIGLATYISCFPSMLIDGLPDDLKNTESFPKSKTCSINIHPKILAEGSSAKCPHFRAGHMRLLSSERYVNKKGAVVFVRPSFIKGQAKTALDDAARPQLNA